MNQFHENKTIKLQMDLQKREEHFNNIKNLMRNLRNGIEETKVLLNFHQAIVDLATKDQERKEYKNNECCKCELGQYGGCESGHEDILYCKELQTRLDKEMGDES